MNIQESVSFDDLCGRYEECYAYVRDANESLKGFMGVVGIGIGPKTIAGKLLPELPSFLVYVDEKRSLAELNATDLIPKEIFGIKTDVVAIGSRSNVTHNEFDSRWLKLSSENFVSFCAPRDGSYRQAS